MRIHILGICGTFMGGLAVLARELGHDVAGSDQDTYPPMSTQLDALGITLHRGWDVAQLQPPPDQTIIGNALSRGNACVEHVLNQRLPYASGPRWLGENVLARRRVLAVAGTHGKTTTSAILAFLLDQAGEKPGFLIGGVPGNFGVSAHLGEGRSFVIEADEYDTAFFDKRSKFVHYHADIAVLNNLEFDHADIFPDLAAIKTQFHHLLRTLPGNGRVVVNADDANLADVLAMGCWTPVTSFGIDRGDWRAHLLSDDGSSFAVSHDGTTIGEVHWTLGGRHNVMNALAAITAAAASGVDVAQVLPALAGFRNVARRMEEVGVHAGITVIDDFAHHPTAIATTLAGLRARVGTGRIIVALEPRSNSMRMGVHAAALAPSLADADAVVFLHAPHLEWDAHAVTAQMQAPTSVVDHVDGLLGHLLAISRSGDQVVFMSNGSFGGAPRRFLAALQAR